MSGLAVATLVFTLMFGLAGTVAAQTGQTGNYLFTDSSTYRRRGVPLLEHRAQPVSTR